MPGELWDEARARGLAPGAELVLRPGDVATPAALDVCFERGVRVRREDGRGAGPGGGGGARRAGGAPAAGGGDALWRALLAVDGTYVVEVRGGVPRVARLGPSGPEPVGGSAR